jgi:hypothetical protein
MRWLALTACILAAGASARVPVVSDPVAVELFTSQGCSSCPPADAVLARLARDPAIVAITRPVTYWDRLGWKDTLAREENTRLQRAYAARATANNVYTPQVVVQGGAGVVGSREAEVRRLVAQAGRMVGPSLRIVRSGGAPSAVLIDGTSARSATVTLVALRSSADVAIGRGENGGRHVRYTNVVRSERAIGDWSGGKARFAIPAGALNVAGADRYAVLVQERGAGPILAATYL